MLPRVLAAALTLSLFAFAPAPFLPKKAAPPDTRGVEGLWEVVERNTPVGKKGGPPGKMFIEIGPGTWAFKYDGAGKWAGRGARYALKVGKEGGLGTFDLRRNADNPAPYGVGIWKFEGEELRIAYRFRGDRPKGFEPATPRSVLMKLKRVKP
jgi:hypothetical protein